MSNEQKQLIKQARDKYGKIYPVARKKRLDQCFTTIDGKIYFWFNSKDHSTHIEKGE